MTVKLVHSATMNQIDYPEGFVIKPCPVFDCQMQAVSYDVPQDRAALVGRRSMIYIHLVNDHNVKEMLASMMLKESER